MQLDLSFLMPSDDGTKPTAVWENSLPTNEFFTILLDEASPRIGHKILDKIGSFRRYFDEDDVISESMQNFWSRLSRPIDGVAELSADGSTIYFNDFKRVFGYLRTTVSRGIISMKRETRRQIKRYHAVNPPLVDSVAPVPSVVQHIKTQTPDSFISLIKDDLGIRHQRVLLLRLDGQSDCKIASVLGINPTKARRCRNEVIDCFRNKFTSPKDLLETMCPESL